MGFVNNDTVQGVLGFVLTIFLWVTGVTLDDANLLMGMVAKGVSIITGILVSAKVIYDVSRSRKK